MKVSVTLEFADQLEAAKYLAAGYSGAAELGQPQIVGQAEQPKRKRRTKAEMEADAAAAAAKQPEPEPTDDLDPPPLADEEDPFGETPAETKAVTIEEVREAIKTYQATVKAKLISKGKDEEEARKQSLETARGLLGKVSGSQIFGDLKPEQYAAVVKAAKDATAKV